MKHRAGKCHENADALSRRTCAEFNCAYSTRAEQKERAQHVRKVEASGNDCSSQENEKSSWCLRMWTEEKLRQKQADDPDILPLMQWKKNLEVRPTRKETSSSNGLTKFYWTEWDSLESVQRVLYRRWEDASGKKLRDCCWHRKPSTTKF